MIESEEQYCSARNLFEFLRSLSLSKAQEASDHCLYTFGDEYEECDECGETVAECGGHCEDRDYEGGCHCNTDDGSCYC